MIHRDGWSRFNIWEHSQTVLKLYEQRCQKIAEEMTCHAQAAELLRPLVKSGDTLLDVGCGGGYFYHSLKKRSIPVNYFGIDPTHRFVELAKEYLPAFGLHPDHIIELRIEDVDAQVDHVVCINVLSNIDNFHKPLERMLLSARKTLILRESLNDSASYLYVQDTFLDENVRLNVYVNTYCLEEIMTFINNYGFSTQIVIDKRTNNIAESVIGHPHYWKFLVCRRIN